MPEFISKLQYKNYEKGEYSDEKARNLGETIELINKFPWAKEQYADVDLTGPSITILDNKDNFLKIGIYYGGMFSLYYLDSRQRYYEMHNVKIEFVHNKVEEFFKGEIDLQIFEKDNFAFGKRSFFITDNFEYHIKFWKVLLFSNAINIYFIPLVVFAIMVILKAPHENVAIPLLTIIVVLGSFILYIFLKFYKKRTQFLKISRGNPKLSFGDDQYSIKAYQKEDIDKIFNYVGKGLRNPNMIEIFEILFKDGSSIKFTNMTISSYTLASKFSDKWNLSPVTVEQNTLKILRYI